MFHLESVQNELDTFDLNILQMLQASYAQNFLKMPNVLPNCSHTPFFENHEMYHGIVESFYTNMAI
jgi:hypothetical protein